MNEKIIGKVSATEKNPATVDDFYFWTDKKEILSPFDIVKLEHLENSISYAEVQEINHVTDATSHFASYISSDFGSKDNDIGNMNRLGMNYVKARIIHNTKNIYTPVLDSTQVFLCNEQDICTALGLDNVKNPIVCGYTQMYKNENTVRIPVKLNENFLIGPEGAHLNVSGISGLAAKTSYSMFLLNALQQKHTSQNENGQDDVAFVFFNVKGRDLLAIDEYNSNLTDEQKKLYESLDLEAKPFSNVKYYYPYNETTEHKIASNVAPADFQKQKDEQKAFVYKAPFKSYYEKLDLFLAKEDDSTGTMESCVNYIIEHKDSNLNIQSWSTLIEKLKEFASKCKADGPKEIATASWRKFLRIIKKSVGSGNIFSDNLNKNEVDLCCEINEHLVAGSVMMIDITLLDDITQSFIFGSVCQAIWEMKFNHDRDNIPSKVIIFVDELNKYASTDTPKNSPILRQLLDITERGRSLGIILFSVEQFRSAIHDRVKGNCATQAYGRTNAIEISKQDYRYIPKVYQNMMTRLAAGEYIISNPALRSLVNIRFPLPTYKQFPNG